MPPKSDVAGAPPAAWVAELIALSVVHFGVGLAPACVVNNLHRAVFPLPRNAAELERDRWHYIWHLMVFAPLVALASVYSHLLLQWGYRRFRGATGDHTASAVLGAAAIGLGFTWGSNVTANKTMYLTGDLDFNPVPH